VRAPADPVSARIVIAGAAGFTNLGDDAILSAMLAELREVLPDAAFVVAGGPEPPPDPSVEWIAVRDGSAVDAALTRADLLIVGGGGFIYDYDGILAPTDLHRGDITFMYPYYRAALAASTRHVPLYFYGIGVDSLVTPTGRALTRDVLSRASAITVRDPISLVELARAGVSAPIVELTADPAVRADSATPEWSDRPEGRVVTFVTKPWLRWAGTWTASAAQYYGRYVQWLAAAADYMVERWDATPVFLPGQRYNDDDLETAAHVVERMTAGHRARIVAEVDDEEQYRGALAHADALVSSRLHPLILATSAGVPVVGIAVSEKVRAFLSVLGLDEQIVSPWASSSVQLEHAVERSLTDRASMRTRIAPYLAAQRRAAARNPQVAKELLRVAAGRGSR
jgi:polysaccharide pyruvyl transferase WcaK-like protein